MIPDPVVFPVPYIRWIVGQEFNVPPGWLVGGSRQADIVVARHAAIFVATLATNMSIQQISRAFYRDAATIRYAGVKTIQRMKRDPALGQRIERLVERAMRALPKRVRSMPIPGKSRPSTVEDIGDKWNKAVASLGNREQRKGATESSFSAAPQ